MANPASTSRTTAIAAATADNTNIDAIYSELVFAANASAYSKAGMAMTPNERDTFIALGYKVEYHDGAYTISWREP